MDEEIKFKVVFVGDSTVGKTSIIRNFLKMDIEITSTLGATSSKIEATIEGKKIVMNVWDTAGQETFRNLVPVYARSSNAAVIVFDQTNKTSWEHVNEWYNYLSETVGNIYITLVANKSDMDCVIDLNDVYVWASEHKVELIRTSAKDGTNVDTLFDTLSQALFKRYNESKQEAQPSPQSEGEKEEKQDIALDTNQSNDDTNGKSDNSHNKGCCN